jgi:hypothetical protein
VRLAYARSAALGDMGICRARLVNSWTPRFSSAVASHALLAIGDGRRETPSLVPRLESRTKNRRARDFQRTQVDHPRIRTGFPGGHQAGLRRLATGVVGFGSGPRFFPTCGIGTKIGLLGRVPAYPALWSRQPVDRNGVTSGLAEFDPVLRAPLPQSCLLGLVREIVPPLESAPLHQQILISAVSTSSAEDLANFVVVVG